MKLRDVMAGIGNIEILGNADVEVASIRYDSRRVSRGDLFAAINGEHFNGMEFINEAEERGARVFLVPEGTMREGDRTLVVSPNVRETLALAARNYYQNPSSKLKVIGITGTNGKTTSSYLVHSILETAGIDSGLIGTVQYLLGGEIISASRTTPESVDLCGLMNTMVQNGCSACILEVSSHAMSLDRVAGVQFETAVFTNLTRDHLDFHKDMEDYFSSKAALFKKADVKNKVINRDDPFGVKLLEDGGQNVLTYGITGSDIAPEGSIEISRTGIRCTLRTPWGLVPVNTVLTGRFNLYNIMAAAASCGLLGIDAAVIAEGLSSLDRIPGRFEKVDRGQPFTAVVDYAHTPDALENVLENARAMTDGRVITVFGCGGDRDKSKRPLMGQVAGRFSDVVYVTSDNPRSEDPDTIIDGIMEGLDEADTRVERIPDRRTAIELAVRDARAGDMVVVAGKGHENYQIIGEKILPFSDVDEMSRAIGTIASEVL